MVEVGSTTQDYGSGAQNSEPANSTQPPITEAIWDRALAAVGRHIRPHNFDMWLRPIRCVRIAGDRVHLQAPNRYIREWFESNYLEALLEALRAEVPREWRVVFEEMASVPEPVPQPAPRAVHPGLNAKYTFENFVVGPSNQLAHGASRAVAEQPGAKWNPLFLYGDAGLGKTHLCQGIGQEIYGRQPGTRIVYVSSERFMNDFIDGLKSQRVEEFRRRYREDCDVLLIDDIQFLAGKDRTQDEFFHTFNDLYNAHKQIVLTSDRVPAEIGELEDRLRTRFQQGLIADIAPPDTETKIAILRKHAEEDKIFLPDDVAIFLSQSIRSNVRELEGALIRIAAHASLTGASITVELARETLGAFLRQTTEHVTVEAVQKAVAAYYGVRVADLKGPKRDKRVSLPRQVAMFLARKVTGSSYPELGQRFGGKDHSTVISACRKIDRLLQSQAALRHTLDQIERSLQS